MRYKQIQIQYGAGKQHRMVQKAGNNSKQIQIFKVEGGPDEPFEINIQTTPVKQLLRQRIKCCGLSLVYILFRVAFWGLIIFLLWKVAVYVAGIV